MAIQLFKIDRDPGSFYKAANLSTQLTQPPEDWEDEVLEYAFRIHPWLSGFTLTVDFVKKLPDRQYGLGGISVRAQRTLTQQVMTGRPEIGAQPQEAPVLAHIPVIVREGELQPLDIFIQGTDVLPLDEDTFRRRLNTSLGSRATTTMKNDPTIIGQLWPPGRASIGGPGAELSLAMLNKFSSLEAGPNAGFRFLRAIQGLADTQIAEIQDREGFPLLDSLLSGKTAGSLAKVANLKSIVDGSILLRPALGPLVDAAALNFPETPRLRGTVAQVVKTADGYQARSTRPEAFDFGGFVQLPGLRINGNDDAVVHTSFEPKAQLKTANLKQASVDLPAGISAASIADGTRTRAGLAFGHVVDFDGRDTGHKLFTDMPREFWSLESGFRVKTAESLESIKAHTGMRAGTTGVFFHKAAGGSAFCTLPVTIQRQDESAAGPVFFATLHSTKIAGADFPMDRDVKLYVSPAVKIPTYLAKAASLLVPASLGWFEIGTQRFRPFEPLAFDNNAVSVTKLAADSFELTGEPVRDVVTQPLTAVDAQYVLAALGVPQERVDAVLDAQGTVTLVDCNVLKLKPPRPEVPVGAPDTELLKAAADIDDPNTIDAVLGLNMTDFEVEDDYMSLASSLEQAQQRVARLLLMSRLGMYSIPEGATKVVMLRLSPIIDALKVLAMQKSYAAA